MTAEEEAIKARREAAENEADNYAFASLGLVGAIERASTVTPEELRRATRIAVTLLDDPAERAELEKVLRAAFGAAGFEVQP